MEKCMEKNLSIPHRRILIGIILLAIFYISGDWILYLFQHMGITAPVSYMNAVALTKFCVSCLACAVVWLITKQERIDTRDIFLLRAAFCCIVAADFFMVLLYPVLKNLSLHPASWIQTTGIIFFMAVQTLLILRHLRGARELLSRGKGAVAKHLAIDLALILIIAIPVIIALYVSTHQDLLVFLAYGVYIILSLAVAWGVFHRPFFPFYNKVLIASGMTAFFLCDASVGLSILSPLATAFVWVFYTPALLALAYSGIRVNDV